MTPSDEMQSNNWPKTVDEAVDRIVAESSDADKERVRSMPKVDLIEFHLGWGMGIRNTFGL